MIEFIVGLAVVLFILVISLSNKGDLKRFQELKNKRRFGGKRLPPDEQAELDRLSRKYPWY